jgi:putative membrane protein
VRAVKRLSVLLFFLAVIVVSLLFSLENQQQLSLRFIGWSTPSFPVFFYILAGFLLGLLFGPLIGLIIVRRSSQRLRK